MNVPQFQVPCVFTQGNGGTPVGCIIPDDGPLRKFNRGIGGLHRFAYFGESLDARAVELRAQGMILLEAEHAQGAGPFLCNFLSPVYTQGLTIEYFELTRAADTAAV